MKQLLKQIQDMASNVKLLYVEDDVKARNATLEMLQNIFLKENITTAPDGIAALKLFAKNDFDLIITDINMPRLNGLEMLHNIRKSNSNISVIIFSAYNESSYFLEAIKLNVDGFIIKPLEYTQFLETLAKVLNKISLTQKDLQYHTFLEKEIQTRTKEIEKKLLYDETTGLLSRYSFFEDLKAIDTPILFLIDINKFRIINEIYGAAIGTTVLKEFAKFINNFAQEKGYRLYRISSDEFLVLDDSKQIDHEKYENELEEFFQKLKDFHVTLADNDTIFIEVTIGISTSQDDPFESVTIALEYAKTHHQHYAMYSKTIDTRLEKKKALQWKEKIKTAIASKGIVPVYQGIVDKNRTTIKYEVLMRLRDEHKQELISPWYFLDIAIKTGLYEELSSFIIFQALQKANELRTPMSINFSYSDIENRLLCEELDAYIQNNSQVGKLLVFEITETQSMQNYSKIKAFIQRFKKYGVRFAIDDFGSGFSNFEYILEMEPDYLKIDGSLIKNIDHDEKALILVKAIIHFSHELNIKIIAEYVHSEAIFNILKRLNVDEYQGFYFHEPLPNINTQKG